MSIRSLWKQSFNKMQQHFAATLFAIAAVPIGLLGGGMPHADSDKDQEPAKKKSRVKIVRIVNGDSLVAKIDDSTIEWKSGGDVQMFDLKTMKDKLSGLIDIKDMKVVCKMNIDSILRAVLPTQKLEMLREKLANVDVKVMHMGDSLSKSICISMISSDSGANSYEYKFGGADCLGWSELNAKCGDIDIETIEEEDGGERKVRVYSSSSNPDVIVINKDGDTSKTRKVVKIITMENVKENGEAKSHITRKIVINRVNKCIVRKPELNVDAKVVPAIPTIVDVNVFPNPSDGVVTIAFTANKPADLTVRVTDINGGTMYLEEKTGFEGKFEDVVDLTNATKGTYVVSIAHGGKMISRQVMLR